MSLKFSGEFCIPGETEKRIVQDHLERYKFASQFVKGKKVLDIACGVGYGSKLLAQMGSQSVIGVDIEKDVITYAKKESQIKNTSFKVGNITKYHQGKYDVIVCFETIEHVKNDKKAIKNLYNLLNSGGLLIISSPNRIITSLEANTIYDKPANKYHVREYTINELVKLLRENGFNVSKNDIYGQRFRFYFKNKFIDKLYEIIFNPNFRSNTKVKLVKFLVPRYFVIVAKKN